MTGGVEDMLHWRQEDTMDNGCGTDIMWSIRVESLCVEISLNRNTGTIRTVTSSRDKMDSTQWYWRRLFLQNKPHSIAPIMRHPNHQSKSPGYKDWLTLDTGMIVVVFICIMYLVLVFGLLFYVKNDWCDLLFKNMTVRKWKAFNFHPQSLKNTLCLGNF